MAFTRTNDTTGQNSSAGTSVLPLPRLDCEEVKLHQVRVHDLKHTFGRRLRAAGVSFEDRQDLLGHRSGNGP